MEQNEVNELDKEVSVRSTEIVPGTNINSIAIKQLRFHDCFEKAFETIIAQQKVMNVNKQQLTNTEN